jgi:hypothetical protein
VSGQYVAHDPGTIVKQLLEDEVDALVERELVCPHVKFRVLRCLVGVRYASEVLDLSSPRLLVEALHISAFADIKRGINEAFIEWKPSLSVNLSSKVSVFSIG